MTEKLKGWDNVPAHIETFVHPHVPSFTRDIRRLYAICRGNEAAIRAHLARTPFEYVSNEFMIDVADFANRTYPASPGETWGFMDSGIIVPVRYKDILGGYYLFEYENQDYSIFAGRELWGYPKTYADVSLVEDGHRITGTVVKGGREILRLEGNLDQPITALPEVKLGPILNLYTIPKADGPGIFSQRIILRDTSSGYQVKSQKLFQATLNLDSIRLNPLKELGPVEVLGAGFQIADYDMNEEIGWGKVLETLV